MGKRMMGLLAFLMICFVALFSYRTFIAYENEPTLTVENSDANDKNAGISNKREGSMWDYIKGVVFGPSSEDVNNTNQTSGTEKENQSGLEFENHQAVYADSIKFWEPGVIYKDEKIDDVDHPEDYNFMVTKNVPAFMYSEPNSISDLIIPGKRLIGDKYEYAGVIAVDVQNPETIMYGVYYSETDAIGWISVNYGDLLKVNE